jgi:membrane carboxypeptidase/penicillin-binding protein PbpC
MRLVGLGLCVPGLMFVGLLAALEGWYRTTLREFPSLPTPPGASEQLPENLARVYWSLYERSGAMTVEPMWPWSVAWTVTRTLVSRQPRMSGPPGWTLADTVARHWRPEDSHRIWWRERLTVGIWLTRHWTAEELLAFEARRQSLGHGLRDLPEAARYYLGKEASDLTLAEAALLVTMNEDPRWREHPECFIDRLQPRRDGRLRHLRMTGALTPEEEAQARAQPVVLKFAGLAPHPCPP